ncbi:MAG: TenA family protein [Microlunatus sp.]|nr:TenA family protein [Microlunatus sp.]
MTFVDRLKTANSQSWNAAVEHRFVHELFAGTLNDDRLAGYLVQDYQFCDAYVALLGAATASAPDLATRLPFARQLGAFAGAEDDYFGNSFDELQVPAEQRSKPVLRPATAEFIALMTSAGQSRSYPHALAVLVVAELLYRDWATSTLPWPDAPKHRGWLEVHNNPDFNAWVDWLVEQLHTHAPTLDSLRDDVAATFARAVELELAFFDACYS